MELLDPKFFVVEGLLRSLGQRFPVLPRTQRPQIPSDEIQRGDQAPEARGFLLFALVVDKQLGELLFQGFDLWHIAHLNVGVTGIMEGVILMIVFRAVKTL